MTSVTFDIPYYLIGWCVYTMLVVFAWYFIYRNYLTRRRKIKRYNFLIGVIVVVLGLFMTISPDYYSYQSLIEKARTWIYPEDLEFVYSYLLILIDYDFYLFRFIIVLPALYLLIRILRKYGQSFDIDICFFILFSLLQFGTIIRSSLADTVFFTGALWFLNRQSFMNFLILCITSAAACVLHKSGFMLIVPLVATLLFSKAKFYKLFTYVSPLIILTALVTINMLIGHFFEESTYGEYAEYQSGSVRLINYASNLLYAYLLIYTLWVNKSLLYDASGLYSSLYKMVYWSVYIWVILVMADVSRYVASRFLGHMSIPIILLVGYSIKHQSRKYIRRILIVCLYLIVINQFSIINKFREYLV